MRAPWWLVFAALAACKGTPATSGTPSPSASSGVLAAPSSSALDGAATSVAAAPPSGSAPPTPPPSTAGITTDGGGTACRVLRGPIELPVRSGVALVVRGESIDAVLNEDGKPRTASFATPPVSLAPVPAATGGPSGREPATGGAVAGYPVACAVSGDRVFCPDRTGAVHRGTLEGGPDRVVASSRAGSRIAAARLAGSHSALGYLASRQTSEGWVSEAWTAVDDDAPVRLSEDGSGATSLAFATRNATLIALTVDARTALTTLHVRPVSFDGHLSLGDDVVVFVGGPGDRRTAGALALPPAGAAWALLPIARDIGSFGMAVVRLDEPAHVDEPVAWSMYPNGLDPAPLAAAAEGGRTWVARVRPQGAELGSTRLLELGQILPDATFSPRDVLASAPKVTDVALAADARGALWVAWVDGAGSWLERVACR